MAIQLPIFATIALASGPVMFYRSFRDFRARQLIENTPTARIRSVAMGLAEVEGAVEERSRHVAPFSGRECVYWEVDISTQARRNQWSVVHRNSSGNPFFVRDDTGVALVYPKGSECRVHHGVEEVCAGIQVPECYVTYMNEQKLAFQFMWRLSMLRFRERILEQGQRVFVLGTAVPRPHVLDISQEEPLAATGTDASSVPGRPPRTTAHDACAVIRRGESERVFIISQDSQRDVTLTLGLRAWGEMIAGPLLTLFGLGYWLSAVAGRGRFLG
jgi:hypothetical protein